MTPSPGTRESNSSVFCLAIGWKHLYSLIRDNLSPWYVTWVFADSLIPGDNQTLGDQYLPFQYKQKTKPQQRVLMILVMLCKVFILLWNFHTIYFDYHKSSQIHSPRPDFLPFCCCCWFKSIKSTLNYLCTVRCVVTLWSLVYLTVSGHTLKDIKLSSQQLCIVNSSSVSLGLCAHVPFPYLGFVWLEYR